MDDHCHQPPEHGPCVNHGPRWFFNAQSGRCELFTFGGCGGNRNNFVEREQCEQRCQHGGSSGDELFNAQLPVRCTREKDEGRGAGYFPKFYFNARNMRCEQMVFQGVGGNDNQFSTAEDCQQACKPVRFTPEPIPTLRPPPQEVTKGSKMIDGDSIVAVAKSGVIAEAGPSAPVKPLPEQPVTTTPRNYPAQQITPGVEHTLPMLGASMPALHNYQDPGGKVHGVQRGVQGIPLHVPTHTIGDKPLPRFTGGVGVESAPKKTGEKVRPTAPPQSESNDEGAHRPSPTSSTHSGEVQTAPTSEPVEGERIPQCPNSLNAMQYADGRPLMCLPGRNQCPDKSVCYFNGIDFFCCPNEDDPYDVHIFGGYDGEEVKHGYKNLPSSLNIKSIRRSRREAAEPQRRVETAFSIDQRQPTRFDGKPPHKISSASQLRTAQPHRNNPCIESVDRGNCHEAHLRYFYDLSLDTCRLFYHTGCGGNANNFATLDECERRCRIGAVVERTATTPKASTGTTKVPAGRCPGGQQPLGEAEPVLCGNKTDSIGCPTGYYCRMGPPDVCCPGVPEQGLEHEEREIRRKPFISSAGSADHHHHEHHEHHHDEHHHHPEGHGEVVDHDHHHGQDHSTTIEMAGEDAQPTPSQSQQFEDISILATTPEPSASNPAQPAQQSSSIFQTPPNMCPDGSDGLVDDAGTAVQCGTGFDGHDLCPRGYYCSIDPDRNGRLCCPMGIQAARVPSSPATINTIDRAAKQPLDQAAFARGVAIHAPNNATALAAGDSAHLDEPAYLGHRPANPGEIIERGSLPSDPKPFRIATPKPKHMEKMEKELLAAQLGGIHAEIGVNPFAAQGVATHEGGAAIPVGASSVVGGEQEAVEPASMPSGEQESGSGDGVRFGHMLMKPPKTMGMGKFESESKYLSGPSFDGNILDYVEIAANEDPFEAKLRELKSKPIRDKSVCFLRPNEGRPCKEDEPSPLSNLQFFYSAKDRVCKVYFYRGCGGNANRFESKSDCEKYCMEK